MFIYECRHRFGLVNNKKYGRLSYGLCPACSSPNASPNDWRECPDYSSDRPNECFFSENHTTIWTPYIVQLRSRDQTVLYDEKLFSVHNIGEAQ